MKHRRLSIRCMAFVAFIAICSFGFAQMPAGFPTMPNTGNPGADAQAYEQAKQTWIANNPSQAVNSPVAVTEPTAAENEAYEAAKELAFNNANTPATELMAERQRNTLEATYAANQENWADNDVRTREAYIAALTMLRGVTAVTITAQEYATMHQELKDLVNANTALFTVTQ